MQWIRLFDVKPEYVEVLKESDKFVTLKDGRRRLKKTNFDNFFKTVDDAKQYIAKQHKIKIDSLQRSVDYENEKYIKTIRNMENLK